MQKYGVKYPEKQVDDVLPSVMLSDKAIKTAVVPSNRIIVDNGDSDGLINLQKIRNCRPDHDGLCLFESSGRIFKINGDRLHWRAQRRG